MLGDRIREARINAGMTQDDLAKKIGAAKNTVTCYEKGTREPDALKIIAIAKALGVTGDYLLGIHIPTDTLSSEARSIAKRYDQLDKHGKSLVDLVIDHEAARMAASEPDEFDIARQAIDALNAAEPDKSAAGG